ncbi:hypothetical protein RhiirA4_536974 [Rhizophagus irregularis]|uniref:Crinkler effector protein N-terminal domain-containing protein n=1 Tax=Rhizophagus irregularis TaxID=588596 RepID=A0A2I1FUL6_9GLOM|nr:hypothetical protein RhiirA4_536974 [Rhizophagus irregularis]
MLCLVLGEIPAQRNLFAVSITNEITLGLQLRSAIYKIKKNVFTNIDENNLILWKVNISINKENMNKLDEASRSFCKVDIRRDFGGEELFPTDKIPEDSGVETIHIIVQRPPLATTVSPKNISFDEVKIEIKNKVTQVFPHKEISSALIYALALIWDDRGVYSDYPGQQNDPYVELKKEPSFFKVNFPRGITKKASKTVDLCLPSYSKSGMNYHNPFYNDLQFTQIVSLVQKKIDENPGDIIVLSGVSGGGKTSTAFGIATTNWSIYIDFSPYLGNYPGSQLQSELEIIRGIKPKFEDADQQNKVFHLLDIAVVSRGLLLIKMLTEGKISTQKEWLFVQLQMTDYQIRKKLDNEMFNHDSNYFSAIIQDINNLLGNLVLIFDEAQVLCEPIYGKYLGSSVPDKKWNLLQGYLAHLVQTPVTCLLAGTYMHMASGISLVTSIGKFPDTKVHIVLELPFLEPDDVLRNLDNVINLTQITPSIREHLGFVLRGRPRNCTSFVRLLISKNRSIGGTKNQVLQELIPVWHHKICSDMAKYLETACEYFGVNQFNPEKAIMDVLRLRVFYNHNYMEAIKLLQHSIIPCKSPECIVLGSEDEISDKIEINPSLESYLIDGIVLYLKNTQRQMVDVFVDNIIMLNNISSIGNEFDAVFITAIINKRGLNVREELNKWKNGQKFDLPSWITPTMKFVTTSNLSGCIPIVKYVNDKIYYSYAIQPDIYSGSDVVISLADDNYNVVLLSVSCTVSSNPITTKKVMEQLMKACLRHQYMECPKKWKKDEEFSYREPNCLQIGLGNKNLSYDSTANEEDNLERKKKEKKKEKMKEKMKREKDLNYDLNYTENIKKYRISRNSEHAYYHEQIKTSTENQRNIYISVELPHRNGERPELFRFNEYGDLVIVVDDRNMEYVFGPVIKKLVERISYKEKNPQLINKKDLMGSNSVV